MKFFGIYFFVENMLLYLLLAGCHSGEPGSNNTKVDRQFVQTAPTDETKFSRSTESIVSEFKDGITFLFILDRALPSKDIKTLSNQAYLTTVKTNSIVFIPNNDGSYKRIKLLNLPDGFWDNFSNEELDLAPKLNRIRKIKSEPNIRNSPVAKDFNTVPSIKRSDSDTWLPPKNVKALSNAEDLPTKSSSPRKFLAFQE